MRFVTLLLFVLVSVPSAFAEGNPDDDLLGKCFKSIVDCEKGIELRKHKPYEVETFERVACEDHKSGKWCVNYAITLGKRGPDEVGEGYLKMACRLDPATCDALKGYRCLKKTGDAVECSTKNSFVKSPTEPSDR